MDKRFINKYKDLVTQNICKANNVDWNDEVQRANLAYKLLTGKDNVITVPLMKSTEYAITKAGQFTSKDLTKLYGSVLDLVIDPVSVAFDIVADNPRSEKPIKSEVHMVYNITVQTNNLSWIAHLFSNAHIYYAIVKPNDVDDMWKLCDYSYDDVNHITPKTVFSKNQVTFGFAHGSVQAYEYLSFDRTLDSGSAFLETKKYNNLDSYSLNTKDLLAAYISEHSLNYYLTLTK